MMNAKSAIQEQHCKELYKMNMKNSCKSYGFHDVSVSFPTRKKVY